jgi:hypothetical protein
MKKIIQTLRNFYKKIVQRFKNKKTMINKTKINSLIKALGEMMAECNELENNPGNASPALLKECIGIPFIGIPLLDHVKRIQKINNAITDATTSNDKEQSIDG